MGGGGSRGGGGAGEPVVTTAVLFLDVGGVLLTNGWDSGARARAVDAFGLDAEELEARHESVVDAFETGRISLDEYLDRTVFHRPRTFERDDFRRFMEAQSRPREDALALLPELARVPGLLLATINNESLELNRFRIDTFGLRGPFTAFFSSCYLGVRKPDPAIFRIACRVLQQEPSDCLFVDDRAVNVEAAQQVGVRAMQYRSAAVLRADLHSRGVDVEP